MEVFRCRFSSNQAVVKNRKQQDEKSPASPEEVVKVEALEAEKMLKWRRRVGLVRAPSAVFAPLGASEAISEVLRRVRGSVVW